MTIKVQYKIFIDILEKASIDFAKPPNLSLENYDGLCIYLHHKLKRIFPTQNKIVIQLMISEILGEKYAINKYTISSMGQEPLWRYRSKDFNKRSEWCKQRIEYFKKKV